jgi:hypothetical protein
MKQTLMASVAALALAAGSTLALAQGQGGGGAGPAGPGGGAPTQMERAPGGGAGPRGGDGAAPGGAMNKDAPGTIRENPAPGPSKGAQERGSQPNQKATQDRTVPDTKQKSTQERNTAPVEKQRSTEQAPAQGTKQDTKQDKSAQQPSTDGGTKQGAAKGEMKSSNVSLTTEQKTTIRNTVISSGPKVTNVNFSISVGTVVPRTVRVAPVPTTLVSIEPSWRDHMYFIHGDEIIIVEAGTLRIIAVIVV